MAIPRFFCPAPLKNKQLIELPEKVAHHAGRALRLKEGGVIVLFNGEGGEYRARLHFEQGRAQADVFSFDQPHRELKGNITLVQALASGDKMDWIIEKAVEMGVTEFIPVQAKHSVLQLSGKRLDKRMTHWQHIIESACEQSGRNTLMKIHAVQSLPHAFSQLIQQVNFLATPNSPFTLKNALENHRKHLKTISFCVGPEGGWSEEEERFMIQKGAISVQLGSRILRTETAGIALVSASTALLDWA